MYLRFTDDPPPYIDGVKINSPHYLCKIILTPASSRNYTIVVSQHEKSASIYYTLRAYATCPFTLSEIKDPYREEKQVCTFQLIVNIFFYIFHQVTGEWKGVSAGGCPNHPTTYPRNPRFRLDIDAGGDGNAQLLLELKGPKQYQIGLEAIIKEVTDESVTAPFRSKSSGPYRLVPQLFIPTIIHHIFY